MQMVVGGRVAEQVWVWGRVEKRGGGWKERREGDVTWTPTGGPNGRGLGSGCTEGTSV